MAAQLIRDEPRWAMPSLTRGPSYRRLRVWRLPDGAMLAAITERGEGTSVTNVAEQAYAAVRREHPGARVFEHYPATEGVEGEEHFDEIQMHPSGTPRWARWPAAIMAEWIGDDALEDPMASRGVPDTQ